MLQIELIPDITHCIETVAKREHSEVVKQLLALERTNIELLEKLEILRLFLETADFKNLRSDSEKHLNKGERVRFLVYLDENILKYYMQVTQY